MNVRPQRPPPQLYDTLVAQAVRSQPNAAAASSGPASWEDSRTAPASLDSAAESVQWWIIGMPKARAPGRACFHAGRRGAHQPLAVPRRRSATPEVTRHDLVQQGQRGRGRPPLNGYTRHTKGLNRSLLLLEYPEGDSDSGTHSKISLSPVYIDQRAGPGRFRVCTRHDLTLVCIAGLASMVAHRLLDHQGRDAVSACLASLSSGTT
jgi:hypothetical protein